MITFAQETEYDGKRMTLVGQWADLAAYYRADDGGAWCYNHCVGRWANCGSYEEFVETFAKMRRGKLFDKAKI